MVNRRDTTEDLADLVRRIRKEKNLSQQQVADNSGGDISKGYIGQIENRSVLGRSVTPRKLIALSKGLDISEDIIFAAARGKSLKDDPSFDKSRFGRLALKFNKVPPDKRVNAEALVELLDRELDRLNQ